MGLRQEWRRIDDVHTEAPRHRENLSIPQRLGASLSRESFQTREERDYASAPSLTTFTVSGAVTSRCSFSGTL
jgi:hypothetical protein